MYREGPRRARTVSPRSGVTRSLQLPVPENAVTPGPYLSGYVFTLRTWFIYNTNSLSRIIPCLLL